MMATDTATAASRPGRSPPWNDPRIRGVVWQILFVGIVVALVALLVLLLEWYVYNKRVYI